MSPSQTFIQQLKAGNPRTLAQCLSLVENSEEKGQELLRQLTFNQEIPVIGITGPPGAGKSTLLSALLNHLENQKIGILAVDPSSPFNYGALLGDRIRLSDHYTNPNIFIRSMASRGAMGGLSPKIIEAVDLMRAADFDYIFVETVGVGQSEVEIAGLADTTVVLLVPDSGDVVQTMKAGVMEIADLFVINKSDHPEAQKLKKNLTSLVHAQSTEEWEIPVLQTIASNGEGVPEVLDQIQAHQRSGQMNTKKPYLFTQKALTLIREHRMRDIDHQELLGMITEHLKKDNFNLYSFVQEQYLTSSTKE